MKKILTSLFLLYSSFAMAQTACDSLDINVKYFAFSDTLIQVNVVNHNTATFMSYPQFTILDANSDTVAHEQVNFFGIGQTSQHVPNIYPGMPASNMFPGTLQLYYITVDSYAVCTWNMNFDLCPDTCTFFYPHIENIGGQQVLGTANWEILNSNQQIVSNGSFTLDTGTQSANDTVCLVAGLYTYKVTNVNMTAGGAKYTGVYGDNMNVSSPLTAFNDPVETISLNLYEACQQTTRVKETKKLYNTNIHSYENNIYLANTGGTSIGEVQVYSIDGKLVYNEHIAASAYTISLPRAPEGVYIVRVMNERTSIARKVFVSGK